MTGLTEINNLKLNTKSFIRADQAFIENFSGLTAEQYSGMYTNLTGKQLDETDAKRAELTVRYTIQSFIKHGTATDDEVINIALSDFNRYWNKNGYLYEHRVDAPAVVEVQRKDGTTVTRTRREDGASKSDVAEKVYMANRTKQLSRKEWIALLVAEVGLTEAGASTYYSNLKRKHGDVVKKAKK